MSKNWWKAAITRAVKTFCQTAAGFLGVGMILSDVNWLVVASASAVAAILSLLTSLAGLPEVKEE